MSYLLDKKNKNKKFRRLAILVVFFVFFFYFRVGILGGLSSAAHFVFRPVFVVGNSIGNRLNNFGVYFNSKKLLSLENETLKLTLAENEARMSNYNTVLDENNKLKDTLGRVGENKNMILAAILVSPNRSPYDTLIIDIGKDKNINIGERVFAYGNVPIGKVAEVYGNSAKVVLFSNPGEKTDAIVSGKDATMQLVGRGGGNFEMILPRDFVLEKETEVVLSGLTSHTIAVVQTTLSDPRDSYQKALLASPVNIFQLNYVEVEKQ
ncbi:MAG: rod shape-determining protein MreC [bacterium]